MCNPVRFDGKDFLEKLEGKKIMFIGDSVSLNHYESLLCLLHAAVPDARITTQTSNSTNTVTFEDHGVSISVFQTHYLVDIEQEQIGRVLKLESIKDGNTWKDMDVLVFNTWLWWYRRGPKQPWDYVQEGQSILKDMDRMVAFQKGLTTWAKWVDSDVDTSKTTVIFQGISPFHYQLILFSHDLSVFVPEPVERNGTNQERQIVERRQSQLADQVTLVVHHWHCK
uniref:Trichome birefringence-like C-terminal domain-containing protein n=2 Tax=Populus TaxID=3689 RepID=A0A4U5QIE7_POPAL|nr:hypothetical protein D5086_0000102060 [Populus alba]